jgi:hypothetical protein
MRTTMMWSRDHPAPGEVMGSSRSPSLRGGRAADRGSHRIAERLMEEEEEEEEEQRASRWG